MHKEELHNWYASQYYLGEKIKEDQMGRACGKHWADKKYTQDFARET